ncbi:hypothetical protein L227DRAFT_575970 [Lentinus tigrinus ALCF2SS1-6]|uniref:Uncharacterized protein n=1 Tax=Lentinus tigrinus ALCF2SS1-6 TaxID=1328759 RepID=A0A5C2S8P7_9APHY|nr:hypothetical protein L227DRAFT_575970 [Lentinus tigrinus ALCF2SS1-6]
MYTENYASFSPRPRVYGPNPETRPVPLRTLYPEWLREEDYVDLSDARGIIVDPTSGVSQGHSYTAPYISYGRSERTVNEQWFIKYFPFPVNTRGHFYFRVHPQFPIAGALRFRLTQKPDPRGETFAQAQDLLTQYGTPWQIPLLALASTSRYDVVQEALRLDGFFPAGTLELCQDMCERVEQRKRVGAFTQFVYNTRNPFYLDLRRTKTGITLVGQKDLITLDQRELFGGVRRDKIKSYLNPFYSGIILCRFEAAEGQKSVHMRVLRVIEPVRMQRRYIGPISQPVVGDYIRYYGKPMPFLAEGKDGSPGEYSAWTYRDPTSPYAHLWDWKLLIKRARNQGVHLPWDKEAVPPPSAKRLSL